MILQEREYRENPAVGGRRAGQPEFAEYVLNVGPDGVQGDDQALGYSLVRKSLSHELEHFPFLAGQAAEDLAVPSCGNELADDVRVDDRSALAKPLQGLA